MVDGSGGSKGEFWIGRGSGIGVARVGVLVAGEVSREV